ncbi:arylsulfatase [Opitutaceae bacterium]|nr:arylsulfatase [Opitutaceae bacterium]
MNKLLLASLLLLTATVAAARQPNVIYILADDLGYGDVSAYGQSKFETPNIAALAERGMLFTQHYSGSTVCAPARCSLMTGLHTGHTVVRGNAEVQPEGQAAMPADTYTVAHHLQQAGYTTGAFGKWGLGFPGSDSDPLKMGFDRFYGYNCQRIAHSYYPAFLWNDDEREMLWGNVGSHTKDYAPDLIHEQALTFIRDNQADPFFLYYAAVQPHADMDAPEEYMEKFRGKFLPEEPHPEAYYKAQPEPHTAFVAMVTVLDDYVGEVVAELKKLGIAEDTLIIFTSDNGPHLEGGHNPVYFDSNGPYRGFKRDLYEGGIHVPMIASWPGTIAPGSASDHISAFYDFMPTMADLIGESLPNETDGISMLPTLTGRGEQTDHDYLYWEFPAKRGRIALRQGDWKAVRYNVDFDPNSRLELYRLSTDPTESINLAAQYPAKVAELDALIRQARTPAANPNFNFNPKLKAQK